MMLPYRAAVRALWAVSPFLSFGDSKLARGIVGRRHAPELLSTWGRSLRDPDRPVAWFHAASLGEGQQAVAVIDALRGLRPELQIVFTFFSPSAEHFARAVDADVATYLPWDMRGPIGRVLDHIRPACVVLTKAEVWPVLVMEAGRRGHAVAMIAGTMLDGSGRRRWPARAALDPAWRTLRRVCAVTEEDAARFIESGVAEAAIRVTGDPGVDSAVTRFEAADPGAPWLAPFDDPSPPTLVAGSTWKSDEDVLLPALETIRSSMPALRLIIAPHEPTQQHVSSLAERLSASGWQVRLLSEVEEEWNRAGGARRGAGRGREGQDGSGDAVIVDRVGPLAEMYRLATVAFVGGGFQRAGLHSVLEPAAAGAPVLFGPGGGRSGASKALVENGGAKIAADRDDLARLLREWLADQENRTRRGRAAADYIEAHRGAAERSAHLLHQLLEAQV